LFSGQKQFPNRPEIVRMTEQVLHCRSALQAESTRVGDSAADDPLAMMNAQTGLKDLLL
jgi:hypothetical protein